MTKAETKRIEQGKTLHTAKQSLLEVSEISLDGLSKTDMDALLLEMDNQINNIDKLTADIK